MEIKILSIDDAVQIYKISCSQFSQGWTKKQIEDALCDKTYFNVGIFADKKLLGFCLTLNAPDDVNILTIATDIQHTRKGYAKRLINFVIDYANKNNKTISLEVKSKNEIAKNLYQSLGFEVVHVRKKYYQDGCDALIMFYKK